MDGGDQREAVPGQAEQAVAEGLVVVHHVVAALVAGQVLTGAQREGERLGEAAGAHGGELQHVHRPAELAAGGRAEGVLGAVEVQTGQLDQAHRPGALDLVQDGVRLGADHVHVVAEPGQLTREVAYVHALTAAERVPAV